MSDAPAPRGTPPNAKQLSQQLGPRLALWDQVIFMGKEFGATWRWAHSEKTDSWTQRAYLPGERFFAALSLVESGFEVSLNLKSDEWDFIATPDPAEQAFLDGLRSKATASGDDPAWLHVRVDRESDLPAIAKLLMARSRRVQPPRSKQRRRK